MLKNISLFHNTKNTNYTHQKRFPLKKMNPFNNLLIHKKQTFHICHFNDSMIINSKIYFSYYKVNFDTDHKMLSLFIDG